MRDRTTRVSLILVGLVLVGFCTSLFPQWVSNPDLSHGLFMPIVFFLLLREACAEPGGRTVPRTGGWTFLAWTLLALGFLGFTGAGVYSVALERSHPMVGFIAAGAVALSLLGALLVFSREDLKLLPLCWSSILAATLWMLCAPIPPGTYTRLTLALQLWISQNVVATLHLLGITAERHGNIIELARTTVGVEEACSGIRSLVSCLFAGLFFSGTLVRSTPARIILVVVAGPLAIGMNFIRSLTLTLLANDGVSIAGTWHDVTGFAVLGVTAALLAGLGLLLARRDAPIAEPGQEEPPSPANAVAARPVALFFSAALVVGGFFTVHTAPSASAPDKPAPDLASILPNSAAGWDVIAGTDLNRFSATLQTDTFIQRTYVRGTPPDGVQITVYIAYWKPGQANASLVAAHTPDACWPGSGWVQVPIEPRRIALRTPDRTLPEAENRLFENGKFPQHVWYWHLYAGAPIQYLDPLSPINLFEIAARYGFRKPAEQMFVRISSNKPWSEIGNEPVIGGILSRLRKFGL